MPEWDEIVWDESRLQSKPEDKFFLFSMSATKLRKLCNVYKREAVAGAPRSLDPNTQRYHMKSRSEEISRYVRDGFPYAELSEPKKQTGKFEDLRKPGWLPTTILVNILRPGDVRNGKEVASDDVIIIEEEMPDHARLVIPTLFNGLPLTCPPFWSTWNVS
jgi:hypothetical protein